MYMYVYNIWSLLYVCVRETLFLAGPEELNEWMSKFLLRRKYFQRHSQLLNSIATEIVFVLKIWNWYFGKQENASKTFWLTFHLFLVLLQDQLWKNIPVTLLQLFQLPNPSALKHLCLLSFEYKACKLQVVILFYSIYPREVSKSFSLSQIFRQWLFQREDIYISFQFSLIAQDVQTALEHSIAGCWCSRFLFSLFAGFIF